MNKGFADLCLTTWLRRPKEIMNDECGMMNSYFSVGTASSSQHFMRAEGF
jgi:hypothetical protein